MDNAAVLLPLGILFTSLVFFASSILWARYRDRHEQRKQQGESDDKQ